MPRGYGTIKAKSWLAGIVKGRPITPHTKHVLKRMSNTVARAHHVMLTSINVDRVARLYATQDYKWRLLGDAQALQDELPGEDVAAGDLGIAHML